jgi:predicted dinucleotide-binding enzyme
VKVKIGVIGAGAVGTAIAKYALLTGHQVALASRRRDKLAETVTALGNGASVATILDAAAADIVILAVPWPAREETLSAIPDWRGKILVDATNPFEQTSPKLVLADLGGRGSSEIIAELAPGARVVKAFNSITMTNFAAGPKRGEATRVLLVSGDMPRRSRSSCN